MDINIKPPSYLLQGRGGATVEVGKGLNEFKHMRKHTWWSLVIGGDHTDHSSLSSYCDTETMDSNRAQYHTIQDDCCSKPITARISNV